MRLSKAQTALVDAMLAGTEVYYMGGIKAYYFRTDTYRACTPTAMALIKAGWAEEIAREGSLMQRRLVLKKGI